ncbi:MAG: ABC transporter permease [Solirubrobacterales bacterium]
MPRYIARRLLWGVALLFVASAVIFLMFYALPAADPAELRAGRQASPAQITEIRETLGLDKPIYEQYGIYIENLVLHFDLGFSYESDAPVTELIFDRMPATIFLTIGAVVIWLVIGIPTGIVSAIRRRSALDRSMMITTLALISAPVFWMGLVLLYLFAEEVGQVQIFPGIGSYLDADSIGQKAETLILPWIVLSVSFAAIYARYMRSGLIEVMEEDYIRTARAKGLSERRVIWRHGVRSAITPIVTLLGLDIAILLAGNAILTESVFNIPGVGRLVFTAIERSDLPVIQGVVLFGAIFIILLNLLVDIAYAYLDPRVRYE